MTNNLLILIRRFCKAPLQHLPDFKGIETDSDDDVYNNSACSTSLTSKGLRRLTYLGFYTLNTFSTSLTSKGLRLLLTEQFFARINLAAPPWLQRDWDALDALIMPLFALAAPPWLQRDWDRWQLGVRASWSTCSTSLTSKWLRRSQSIWTVV